MKQILLVNFVFILVSLTAQAQQVYSISNMRKVMTGESLAASLNWDSIPKANLYGLSPYDRISGEVTIVDGVMYVSKVRADGEELVAIMEEAPAPFAVYAHVEIWETYVVEVDLTSEEELQSLIGKLLLEKGMDMNKPTPFMLRGEFRHVAYHIISKPSSEREHSHQLHDKAKRHFEIKNVSGEILGFYSKQHQGIFTHQGSFLHCHFIDQSRTKMGHLESLVLKGQIVVMLPKK